MFGKGKKTNRILLISLLTLVSIGILFFLLRGPYLSNSIKRIIIPVLENATQERIIIDKAVINLFPFYLQAKGLKVFDKDGNRLLWVTKTRAYIDLLGLFSRDITIRRLTIKEPNLTINEEDLKRIIYNVKKYLSKGGDGQFSISLKNMKMTEGKFTFRATEELTSFLGSGLFIEMSVKSPITVDLSLKEGILQLQGLPKLKYGLDGKIKIKNHRVEISSIKIRSSDSTLEGEGEVLFSPKGRVERGGFSGKAKVFIDTISKFFGLAEEKDGVLSFSGLVDLVSGNGLEKSKITIDLETNGQFYLETLMKILKVDENIKGRIVINGKIHGTYPELIGEGTVKLKDAILGTLLLNEVSGRIRYKNRKFTLDNFIAYVYEGEIRGDASILIPHGDYSVTASVLDVSSPQFFKFIKWKAPFPEGKVNGNFHLTKIHGQDIKVTARVNYLNTSISDKGPLNRLKNINGDIYLKSGKLRIKNSILSTSISNLFLDGVIDLKKKTLTLDVLLESKDATDLTAPSFNALKAPLRFKGKAQGHFNKPEISGSIEVDSGTINGFLFTDARADLTYNIKSLSIDFLRINQGKSTYDISGSIIFRKAKKLFSFEDPFYNLEVTVRNGKTKPLLSALYKEMPVSGFIDGKVSFKGDLTEFTGKGNLIVKDSVIYGQQFDKIIIKAMLHPKNIEFQSVTAHKGKSKLTAKGTLFFDKRFKVSVFSKGIRLSDIAIFHEHPVDALFSLNLNSSGTLKRPDLKFSMNILESTFNSRQIGKGKISGRLKNKKLRARGSFFNDLISVNAKANFSRPTLWTVDVNFKKGRYDFLLAGLLREAPRDVSASIEGVLKLKARGGKISIQSKLTSVNFGLYGYNFRNNEDIILELSEKELRIKSFSLTGENADIFAAGVVKIGKNFNVTMKGGLNITPLKVVSNKITSLNGRSDFVIKISGLWKTPEIVGEINIKDATMKLIGFPHKIGPLNGSIFFDGDKLTIDSLKTNLAGGTVVISGAGYFKKLALERLFVSSVLTGVKLTPVEGIGATFDGRLFYETSSKGSSLTGDINIKKAKYEKKVEWKSWLLRFKEIKRAPIEQPTFLGKTVLNIRFVGSENIFIDNNIAKTPVKLDLTLMGTITQYGLIGRVEAEEGSIYFRGNEFKLLDGSNVDFVEPNDITPVFHIRAETFARNHYIKLSLDGTMDEFTLSLFSDPPLPEMDILTLLTFGQVDKGTGGFESGIAASEATAILTGELQEEVEEKFRHITGFERFEVEPHTTATGAVSPKVTVGKRFLGDKLFVIYSTSIGTTEEHIIRMEYSLSKSISIVGSRNELGSTGGDIKYRFEFK
jgi:translocation and assembly module TamB